MKKRILISIFSTIILFIALSVNSNAKAAEQKDLHYNAWTTLDCYTFEYNAKQIKPKVIEVKYVENGKETILKEGIDFTVTYGENIQPGDGYVYINGKGNYKGTTTTSFFIRKYLLEKAIVSDIPDQTYTGKKIKPVPASVKYITYNGETITLQKDKDYELYYPEDDIILPGITYLQIRNISGNTECVGSQTIYFKINPKPVENLKATKAINGIKLTWTHSASESINQFFIERKANNEKEFKRINWYYDFKKNQTDFSYTDENATTGKKYTYRIVAQELDWDYQQQKNVQLLSSNVTTAPITFVKGTNPTITSYNDKTNLKWSKVANIKGYQIYRATSKNGEYKLIKTLSNNKTSYTDKGIKKFTTYFYKIRTFTNVSSNREYSAFSTVKEKSALQKVEITKNKYEDKKIKLKWKKIKKISGYEIYRATSKNGKYTKIATVSSKKISYNDKNVKIGKVYYYKVRAYKKKKKYGQFSSQKKCLVGTRKQQMNKVKLLGEYKELKEFNKDEFNAYKKFLSKNVNSKMSTYDKAKTVYKYVVTHLSHKDSNCVGFAGSLGILLRMIGLDAHWVSGSTRTTSGGYTQHQWVVVFINKEPYTFDASLERHDYDRNKKKISYKYFFKKPEELKGVYKIGATLPLIGKNDGNIISVRILSKDKSNSYGFRKNLDK